MLYEFPRSISADSTIEPLNISFTWCARLFEAYQVRPEFLQVLLAFGNEPLRAEACSASNAYIPTWDDGCKQWETWIDRL